MNLLQTGSATQRPAATSIQTSEPKPAPAQIAAVNVAGVDELLTPKVVSMLLGVGVGLLRSWRVAGTGPKVIGLSPRVIRYRASEVEAFLAARTSGGGQ